MDGLRDVEASCAICGATSDRDCPHESERLEISLNQAMFKWKGFNAIREWVLDHARNHVLGFFEELKTARYQAHLAYLHTLPCYSLYSKFLGQPPLNPLQLQNLRVQIDEAEQIYKAGIDDDWRRALMTYPTVLDYFFEQVGIHFPDDQDPSVLEPQFGGPVKIQRRIKARQSSRGSVGVSFGRRKKEKRRHSRGRTPVRR